MRTQWRELKEFPSYAVSENAEFINLRTDMDVNPSRNQNGHSKVTLVRDRRQHTRSVAVLVAEAFLPEHENPAFNTPIHLDGDLMNCCVDNLMWRPRWFAIKYHRQFRQPAFHNGERQILDENTDVIYDNMKHTCTSLGLYHHDVVDSYVMGHPVFPDWHTFRLV